MSSFFKGDTPSEALLVVPTRDGSEVDLSTFTGVTVYLGESEVDAALEADHVAITLPELNQAGKFELRIVLTSATAQETFQAESVIVEDPGLWLSLAEARRLWRNNLSDEHLFDLLETARVQCENYAPALEPDSPIPPRYKHAQWMQARNILNASKTDPASGADGDLFVIRPFPLDNFIKELLRPRSGTPRVG